MQKFRDLVFTLFLVVSKWKKKKKDMFLHMWTVTSLGKYYAQNV